MTDLSRQLTKDGSRTVFSPQFGATYHSTHGALRESKHVFIENGLKFFDRRASLKILELGFGTGLNAILSLRNMGLKQKIDYQSIEAYPLDKDFIFKLDFQSFLNSMEWMTFEEMHTGDWNARIEVSEQFSLTKHKVMYEVFDYATDQYDLVYHDAFAPSTQPEFWERPFVDRLYHCLRPKGALVTYCAKGSFKRALRDCGFQVEALPGPPGKREMTRAHKII